MKSSTIPALLIVVLLMAACGGPDGAEGHNHAGVQHFQEGRLEEAITSYSRAIKADSEYAAAYYNRGQAYFALGRSKLAVKDHTRAIELSPNDPQLPLAYAGRAMAYTLLDEDEQAQGDMSKAIELGFNPGVLIAMLEELKKQR
jgi:tetratricopeptide (TPR) repeat protein